MPGSYRASIGHNPLIRVKKAGPAFSAGDVGLAYTTPATPINLAATPQSTTQISLTWAAGSGGATPTSYELSRSPNGSSGWVIISSALVTTFSDTGLTAATQYFYRVRAFALAIPSAAYATTNATTQSLPVGNALISDGFEDGTYNAWNLSDTAGSSFAIIVGGAAEGARYSRSTLTYASSSTYRAEHVLRGSSAAGTLGGVMYYGISVYVPSTTLNDAALADAFIQYHPGGGGHWAIRNDNGNWQLEAHNLSGGNSNMGAITKNVWHRVIARFLWATNTTGSVKIWLNPASEATAPTHQAANIATLPAAYTGIVNFKMGCYKPAWQYNVPAAGISPRVYYHDNAKVGLAFADVL